MPNFTPMLNFTLPLSGDVTQLFNPAGNQFGLININLGKSSNPVVEGAVLSDVASYGKQLGRIGDVLKVLVEHFHPEGGLTKKEGETIERLKRMLADIDEVKDRHKTTRESGG
jgi:hypothetical protein